MKQNQFFSIVQNNATPTVYIDGIIGDDADYASFRNAFVTLLEKGVKRIKLIINSGGGSMIQGFAMYDLLKYRTDLIIEVEVIGMAASMAGILMLAASPGLLGIHKNASIMTHKARMAVAGSSDDLREVAKHGDKLENQSKQIVINRTGKKAEDVEAWFEKGKDKWFTAEEAVAEGLCDYIIESGAGAKERPAKMTNEADVFGFYNSITTQKKHPISMNKVIAMLTAMSVQHNLTAESTEDQVAAVFKTVVDAQNARISALENQLKAGAKEKAVALIEAAIAAGKVKAETKDKMIENATADYDGVKLILDNITGRVDVNALLDQNKKEKDGDDKKDKRTFSQYSEDELRKMQTQDPTRFEQLRKEEYGV